MVDVGLRTHNITKYNILWENIQQIAFLSSKPGLVKTFIAAKDN